MKKAAREDVFEDTQQMLLTVLRHRDACYNLTQAALVLLAANRRMSPHDAFMDACQMYCHILRMKWHCLHACRHGGRRGTASYRAPSRRSRPF